MSKSRANATKVYYGIPRVRVSDPQETLRDNDASVEIRHEVINELSQPLTVILRNGLPLVVKPSKHRGGAGRRLIVKYSLFIPAEHREQTVAFLENVTDTSTETMKALKKAFEQHHRDWSYKRHMLITLEYVVTEGELKKYGPAIYHRPLDMWFSLEAYNADRPQAWMLHPFSEDQDFEDTINTNRQPVQGGGALYAVEIVDNEGIFSDRYLNIAGQIYLVKSKQDGSRPSGIWVTRTEPTEGSLGTEELKVNHYPFGWEEANKRTFEQELHLFRTYAEAISLGDIASVRKERIQEKDHELQLARKELEGVRLEHDKNKQEHEAQKQEWERQRAEWARLIEQRERLNKEVELDRDRLAHQLEMERMRKKDEQEDKSAKRKDQYEEKSAKRKDWSEVLKWVPTAISAAAAILVAILTVMKS